MTANPAASRWLVRPRPAPGASVRLFALPHAGGGASAYRLWPDGLPPTVEVCAVQPPGRETRFREAPFLRIAPLASALAEGLGPHLEPPYAFFGHSLGALVAFELARELRRRGAAGPALLIASGRAAPQVMPRRPPLHDLPEPEFREELRKLEGTPRAVLEHDELMTIFSPLLRADFAVNETYAYRDEPPLDVPIVAVGGLDDPWVSRDELGAWRDQTTAAFACHQLPGKHFYLQAAAAELLAIVGGALRDVEDAR